MPLRGSASNIAQASLQLHKHPMHQRYQMDKMLFGTPQQPLNSLNATKPYEADARLVQGRPSIFGPASSLKRKIKSSETARSVESGLKSGVKFWYGETPKEYATGEVIGYAAGVALGGGYKVAKGLYKGGKSIYKALKHADSMVPGNRPPRPKTPPAPDPKQIETRRELLKRGALIGAGATAANLDHAADFIVDTVHKIKGGGKIFGKSFSPKIIENVTPEVGRSGFDLAAGHLSKSLMESMPKEYWDKIVARNIKTNKKRTKVDILNFGKLPETVDEARKKFERQSNREAYEVMTDMLETDNYDFAVREAMEEVGPHDDVFGFADQLQWEFDQQVHKYYEAGIKDQLGNLSNKKEFNIDKKKFEDVKKRMLRNKDWQAFRYSQNKAPLALGSLKNKSAKFKNS